MLQESLVLRMVGTVRTSVKVFSEKVASNLVLMIPRAPPGRIGMGVRLMVAFEVGRRTEVRKRGNWRRLGKHLVSLFAWMGLRRCIEGVGEHPWEASLEKQVEGEGSILS